LGYLQRPGDRVSRVAARLAGLPWIGRLVSRAASVSETSPVATPTGQAVGLLFVVVLIFGFVAMSHEVTPFFMVSALVALVVVDRLRPRMLPIAFGVMAVAWVSYMTVPFLAGHAAQMLAEI